MPAKIETLELEDAEVQTAPLPYEKAEDLMPDIGEIVSRGFDQVSPELARLIQSGEIKLDKDDPKMLLVLLPAIGGVLRQLGGGKLKAIAPRILATTSVVVKTESGE